VHETGVLWAMAEVEGVPQFMDSFLDNPMKKYSLRVYGREIFFEATGGYDAGIPTQLCFSVNMGENRNEEVHVGDAKRF
jgi:hypothetical protein